MARALCGVLLTAAASAALGAVVCRDNNGDEVDWFTVFKMPDGTTAAYWDANTGSSGSLSPSIDIGGSSNALHYTLSQLGSSDAASLRGFEQHVEPTERRRRHRSRTGEENSDVNFIAYNDEPAGSSHESKGHTKGVLGFSGRDGFWLVHSTPRYPFVSGSSAWGFPSDEDTYGQSFLCISVDSSMLELIGSQIRVLQAGVYGSSLSSSAAEQYPNISLASQNNVVTDPVTQLQPLNSRGGFSFLSFAKTGEWDGDLYSTLVAQQYSSSLWAETWRRDPKQPSDCSSTYTVENVDTMQFGSTSYSYTKDHSKMAVALKESVLCIGGINRMLSQFTRGGGTVCFRHPQLWAALKGAMVSQETC